MLQLLHTFQWQPGTLMKTPAQILKKWTHTATGKHEINKASCNDETKGIWLQRANWALLIIAAVIRCQYAATSAESTLPKLCLWRLRQLPHKIQSKLPYKILQQVWVLFRQCLLWFHQHRNQSFSQWYISGPEIPQITSSVSDALPSPKTQLKHPWDVD